jgi:adenosylcobinamide kinase/adenosylcobinamide-phosphate guanylyltransferase
MMILVTGGAASGKSEYAERLLLQLGQGKKKTYLATMQRDGKEAEARIARHKELRAGKGFETVECPVSIARVIQECHPAVLLECLSNLTANEMFCGTETNDATGEEGFKIQHEVAQKITEEILRLSEQVETLVIVTNEVFSDGLPYAGETLEYIRELGRINRLLAQKADSVVEVVYGIPLWHKGLLNFER